MNTLQDEKSIGVLMKPECARQLPTGQIVWEPAVLTAKLQTRAKRNFILAPPGLRYLLCSVAPVGHNRIL